MIVIISGEPGTGKTWNALQWEEPITYLDLEKRVKKETYNRHFSNRLIDIKDVVVVDKQYKTDYYASYLKLKSEIGGFLKLKSDEVPSTLVVDGVTDVRNNYCKALWLNKNPGKKQPGRESWRVINDWTRDLLEPLMNMSKVLDFNLVFTAQFKDDYTTVSGRDERGKQIKESSKGGRIPATKDWQNYGGSTLVELSCERGKYRASITKSPVGLDEFEITGKSLYEELIERGI